MIVSHRHRFIFLKTLKTAGTSVEIALSRVCGPDDVITPLPEHDERLRAEAGGRPPQNYLSPPLPVKVHEHIRAGKVRQAVGPEVWDSYFKFAVQRNPWDAVVSLYFWITRHGEVRESFEDFLQRPNAAKLAHRNHRITHLGGEPVVDRTLRFEQLDRDLGAVWERLGLPGSPDLPRAKGQARPRSADYRDFYTPQSRDLVARLFETTVAELGYEF